MKHYKEHNKNNIAEERFNQIKSHCDNWNWEKSSVVIFGGCLDNTLFSGSRASLWGDAPSASDNNLSARGISNHRIIKFLQ